MYHRVIALDRDPWQLGVTPEHFQEHMQVLKKYARPVKMKDMGKGLRRLSLGTKEVVVTFDDGYADNYRNARPVLEKNETAATFFIVSGAVKNKVEFWWDELERIILAANILPSVFDLSLGGRQYQWKISDSKKQEAPDYSSGDEAPKAGTVLNAWQLYYALWKILSQVPMLQKKEALLQIGMWAGDRQVSRRDYLPMNPSEIKTLAQHSLFEIGAHTFSHPMLSRLSVSEQENELAQSKHGLEDLIGQQVTSFCYPHGDYSADTVRLVRRLQFRQACTVSQGLVTRQADPYLLPRFVVLDWDGDRFERNLRQWLGQSA